MHVLKIETFVWDKNKSRVQKADNKLDCVMPKVSSSVLIALGIFLLFAGYFGVRTMLADQDKRPVEVAEDTAARADKLPQVIVQPVSAQPHQIFATLKGQTAPDRIVTVRSETMGVVTDASVREGQYVKQGTLLCGLGIESRAARVAEAEAAVASSKLDYESAAQLEEKGWTTSNRAAANKAALDRAEAALAAAKIEMAKTKITAPFGGIFESRLAEKGDFLSPGSPCGTILDLNPIIVELDATEAQVARIQKGQTSAVTLNDGRTLDGTVRFISRTANPQTRTFKVEIAANNADMSIAAGLTASVDVAMGQADAVLLTPALLVLHEDGRVGVRYVNETDTVQFADVTVVDDATDGVWVTGIPQGARVLATGQDYVREGVQVEPVMGEG